jgi:hypothetical protein
MLRNKTAVRTNRQHDIQSSGEDIRLSRNLHRTGKLNPACASQDGKLGIPTSRAGLSSRPLLEQPRDLVLLLLI